MTPDSYEEQAIDLVATMLATCAAWQTAIDAGDATIARGRIVLRWGGDAQTGQATADAPGLEAGPVPLAAVALDGHEIELDDGLPYALIDEEGDTTHSPAGIDLWDRSGSIRILLRIPPTDGDQPWQILRRASNLAGTIAEQLRAQIGSPGGLAEASVACERPILGGPLAEHGLTATCSILITWSA